MKYIKTFNTHSEYEAYIENKDGFTKPNLSFCKNQPKVVHYNPYGYKDRYLTFVAKEQGTFTVTIGDAVPTSILESISYSTDEGETWTTTNNVNKETVIITTPTINQGVRVLWKGTGVALSSATVTKPVIVTPTTFSSTGEFDIEGNIMSMISGDSFATATTLSFIYTFYALFSGCTGIVSAENLVLPATTLSQACYQNMFYGCTSLTTAPELPANKLVNECYYYMFYGCTNLNYIKCLAKNAGPNIYTKNWVSNVASNGTFIKDAIMTNWTSGDDGIPRNWTVQDAS